MTILLYFLIIILPIALLSIGINYWIKYNAPKEDKDKPRNKLVAYIYNYSGILKAVGFITALLFCIALWNYRYEFNVIIEAEKQKELIMDIFDLTINTEQKKPPKPKPILTPKIIETPEEELEDEPEPKFEEEPQDEPDPVQGLEGDEDGEDEEEFDDKEYSVAEVQQLPKFMGGVAAFLKRHYVVPPVDRRKHITGKIYVSFLIGRDGSISEVKILRGLTPAMDKEAIRVIKSMPKWDPAYNAGVPVKVRMNQPINIVY